MKFSRIEMETLSNIGKGNNGIRGIAEALNISRSQAYRTAQKLGKKGITKLSRGKLEPKMKTHVSMLLKLMARAPNLAGPLSGIGIEIYKAITEPKPSKDIQEQTRLHKTTIAKKLRQGQKISLITKEKGKYGINEKLWPDAKDFLEELKTYEESIDERVPVNSIIYHKTSKEIIFSNNEELDAEKTAFSAYKDYGIQLMLITNYYCLPKRNLTTKQVFRHSLYVAEKTRDTRHIIFTALFYLKFRKQLKGVKSDILDSIKSVLKGKKIKGFPTLEEIRDRAKIYGIKV